MKYIEIPPEDYRLEDDPDQNPKERKKKRSVFIRLLLFFRGVLVVSLVLTSIIGGVSGGMLYSFYKELPNIARLEEFRPSLVTKVYDRNGELIGEFFVERRTLVSIEDLPKDFVDALIAVEDKRFYQHFGVDLVGIARAFIKNLQTGRITEGASTITQQLARLLFLSPEKKYVRKIKEMMLAIQIEQKYTKQEILELYANQVYLGHGAYGMQAAAKLYFGKDVRELDLGECAVLAGLVQLPAVYSPITHPEKAKKRQEHVIKRMIAEGYITPKIAREAIEQPFQKKQIPEHQINKAPYFVEHVRQYLDEKYGRRVYQDGLQVYTTLDLHLQEIATAALREGLRTIQKRHGFVLIDQDKTPEETEEKLSMIEEQEWKKAPQKGDLIHAIVTEVTSKQIRARVKDYTGTISQDAFSWAGKDPRRLVRKDDIILGEVLEVNEEQHAVKLALDLEPLLEGALISIDPKTGDILAMVGGYDFYRSKFNRAVQAPRQPGSAFKPFLYLTALERGFTPANIIVDEPVTFLLDPKTEQTWSPKNFADNYKGPITVRHALETSINVIAAKLMEQIGPHAVVDTARRLGMTSYLNPYLSLALGSSEVYVQEIVAAYCAFANRGYLVEPIFVTKVLDHDGNVLEENIPRARQVISEDTNYILVSMLEGVVQRGTATAAKDLGRPLAGKTGTTNDNTDAWFIGFSPSLVTGVWVGYDQNRESIGKKETGSRAALPIWMTFMKEALKDHPIEEFPVPAGVSFVQIDAKTGLLASPQCGGEPFTEVFKKGTEPKEYCYQYQDYSQTW